MSRILVVDDDPALQQLVATILAGAGHDVSSVGDVAEALQCVASQPIDLVLTDILLPGGNGVELISRLLQANAALRIIAMSGGRGRLDADFNLTTATMVGAAATLHKPFRREQLLQAVQDLIRH